MRPHSVGNLLGLLITAAIVYWLGQAVLGIVSAATGYMPETGFGRALWGIVPAVPVVLAFIYLLGFAIWERIADR